MIDIYIARAREIELALSERTIAMRHEYHTLRAVDRLERALKSARGALRVSPAGQA